MKLSKIKELKTLDLESYEIRGAKPGINNAKTTGPVYVSGVYTPDRNDLSGNALFSCDSSIVTDIHFAPPYSSFDVAVFKSGDFLIVDSTQFSILGVRSSSVELDRNFGMTGTYPFRALLGPREYLVEPDKYNNTFYGNATFTQNSTIVIGSGFSRLASGDFIKRGDYQVYYPISNIANDSTLVISRPFGGATGFGAYTAKKQRLDRMRIRYTKDNFLYEKKGAYWKTDGTTGSNIPALTDFGPLADGIQLRFTPTIDPNNPDLMDTATVEKKVFAAKTDREIFQFALPVVPNEKTFALYINDVKKDPDDYVINYHPDPVYLPPPLPENRRVANILFLNKISNVDLDPTGTATGSFNVTDTQGNQISGILFGSETVRINGTLQEPYKDYIVDVDSGMISTIRTHTNEILVNFVARDLSDQIDYGIKASLNGQRLKYTVPPRDDDDIRIVLSTGRVVPAGKDHPAPSEEYIVEYQVDAAQIAGEQINVTEDMTSFRLSSYPVKDDSIILTKNGSVLEENVDYRVSSQTGRVILYEPLHHGDSVSATYTPFSLQTNGLTYENGKTYCTVYNAPVIIENAADFVFSIVNTALDTSAVNFLQLFNDTRSSAYNLNGALFSAKTITLQKDSTNLAIGLSETDVITATYKFEHDGLEYAPIGINNFTILEGSDKFYLVNRDATALFPAGAVILAIPSNAARNYYLTVLSAFFDGEDTVIHFVGRVPEDIINPFIYVTDASVNFARIPVTSSVIIKGSNQVVFPGLNAPNTFRTGCILRIGDDAYMISEASYDSEKVATVVTLQADVENDYTSASVLSSIMISETPIYIEGSTLLQPSDPVILSPPQASMAFTTTTGKYGLSATISELKIMSDESTFVFPYSIYPRIRDLASGITTYLPSINIRSYVPDWMSSKIIPLSDGAILPDSTAVVFIEPSLRLNGNDTTDFEIVNGQVVLEKGLKAGERYKFDYQGQRYLGNSLVNISTKYFTVLPAGSKISASFEYDNLDQFYVQVMSQRYFLENVIEPRQKEEANQNQGNVGQGGDLPGDEDQGNAEGGLVDNEYRRKDAEITCRVYSQIYKVFSSRAQSFADELFAATGLKLLNNDGLLTEYDQLMGTKPFNRMFPPDYTNLEPYPIAALTAQTSGPGQAIFVNGSKTVTGISTIWSKQLKNGDFIRPKRYSKDCRISEVLSDTLIMLTENYNGTSSPADGEDFVLTAGLPLYDTDGFMGAKINGTKSGPFNLTDKTFNCYLDHSYNEYVFKDAYKISAAEAARRLSANISGLNASVENIYDASTVYGLKSVIVFRTNENNNHIRIGNGNAVQILGFTPDTTAYGNLDRTDSSAEVIGGLAEARLITSEKALLDYIINKGVPFKLDRTCSDSLNCALQIYALMPEYLADTSSQLNNLETEIAALTHIIKEPSLPSYAQSLIAYNNAVQYTGYVSSSYAYTRSIKLNWQGKGDSTKWVLDFDATRQHILGISGQTSFILSVNPTYDRRILNIDPDCTPSVYYLDPPYGTVFGVWTGWDPVYGVYSQTNSVTFIASSPFTGDVCVYYQTISDAILGDRTNFIQDRSSQIVGRLDFLLFGSENREARIRQHLIEEELFRTADGSYGNLYAWADNRFNRSGGCEAKLKQQESLAVTAKTNLIINRRFL